MRRNLSPEAHVRKTCIQIAEARGCYHVRTNAGLVFKRDHRGKDRAIQLAPKGTPDDWFVVPPDGLALAVEFKTPRIDGYSRRTKPSEAQLGQIARIRRANGYAEVVRTPEEMHRILDALGCPKPGEWR